MKIYNKKSFASGVFMVSLGCLNFILDLLNQTVDIAGIVLAAALFFLGVCAAIRGLSQKLAKEDHLERLDERNQLIEWKAKSQSFRLTQGISFVMMISLMVAGKLSGDGSFIAMGIGLAFAVTVSMFTELATFLYYEEKN